MGDRDTRIRGSRDPRCHPRNDLERQRSLGQCLGLLASTPKHQRVASLEANDAVLRGLASQQLVDRLLDADGHRPSLADS